MTFILGLAASYPIITTILAIMGVVRVVMKPVMSIIRMVVKATPSKADDKKLNEVERSWWWKAILYILDLLTSIKL